MIAELTDDELLVQELSGSEGEEDLLRDFSDSDEDSESDEGVSDEVSLQVCATC